MISTCIHRVFMKNLAMSFRRLSSKEPSLIDVAVDSEGIATATMQNAPVNSLNTDMLNAIHNTVDKLNRSKCKGMILASAFPRVYSAGIDFNELHKPDLKRLEIFTDSLFDLIEKFFDSEVITAAAINGYTAAGGSLVSMLTEYRVMCGGEPTIGFNDTSVGVTPEKWAKDLFVYIIGTRRAEHFITSSAMLQADEAFKIGVIDEVATDREDAIIKCKNFIKLFDNIPRDTRISAKRLLREPYLNEFKRNRSQYKQNFIKSITNTATQEHLDNYVKMMKQKKNKA